MRLLPGFSLTFVLALLLIGTTPIGTGAGMHQFDLVHPLFSHVHIVNGRILSHDQVPRGPTSTSLSAGPAFGAGSGAEQGIGGPGISPIVPRHALSLVPELTLPGLASTVLAPVGRVQDAPPDPPPNSSA